MIYCSGGVPCRCAGNQGADLQAEVQQGPPARAAEDAAPTEGVVDDSVPSPMDHAAVKAMLHAASFTKVKPLLVLRHPPCPASSADCAPPSSHHRLSGTTRHQSLPSLRCRAGTGGKVKGGR